jgi:ATP-dependent Clp protease ATP-binding subunit ClpC
MKDTFEKFSNNYKKSLKVAAELAVELNNKSIEPQHILYGLVAQRGSVGAELFTTITITANDIKSNIAINPKPDSDTEVIISPDFSKTSKEIIQKSVKIAYINEHKYVGTEHLLAAILEAKDPNTEALLEVLKVSKTNMTSQVVATLKSASKLPDLTETFKVTPQSEEDHLDGDYEHSESKSILDLFGTELTSVRMQKKIDPVIGRNNELYRMIQILSRRNKNNPIILGEPGVGKTAIVEGLAQKIYNGDVPAALENKKIYTIDLTSTVAGTMYRGEFEGRIKQIIDEVKRRPEVILFIDEIHNIVGTGSASGSMDAANILKPALARGEIRCIGATTYDDYRKKIENDPALDRRFQPVKLKEPLVAEAREMLAGIKNHFEAYHRVHITSEAIDAAVELSSKYITNKFLPDKAIDLIDEASAAIKISKKPTALENKIKKLTLEAIDLQKKKKQAVISEDYDLAISLKTQIYEIEDKLDLLEEKLESQKDQLVGEINKADIARVISKATGIPAEDLVSSEKKKIINLENSLKKQVIGQDQPIDLICQFIKRAKAGLTPENKPLASFLLVGPSGTGKTHTAKILADKLFSDKEALIKIDMSEYSEKFNTSKLIGAPAGYVGYKESGQLTEKVKHKPYSIVLFDEIEKANPEIFDLLLQVLEDGYLTDAAGTRINFQNTIIIMTSNIGSHYFTEKTEAIGFDSDSENKAENTVEQKIIEESKEFFKTEFINRLDKIICFSPLVQNDLQKITKIEFDNFANLLQKKGILTEFDHSASKLIAQISQRSDQGARGIKKAIQEMIEYPISKKILEDELIADSKVKIKASKEKIELEVN